MKKYVVALAVTISVCTQVALAKNNQPSVNPDQQGLYQNRTVHDPIPAAWKGDKISDRIQIAFLKEFTGVSDIKWEKLRHNIYQVSFNYNNERLIAFYDEDAKLVATSRIVSESNLPLIIKQSIARKYASYNLMQVIELTQNDETSYLLTFENERVILNVQAYYNGSFNNVKKEKKNFVATL